MVPSNSSDTSSMDSEGKSTKGVWSTPDPAGLGTQPYHVGHKRSLSGTAAAQTSKPCLQTQPTAASRPSHPSPESPRPAPAATHGSPARQTCPCSPRPRHTSSWGGCTRRSRTGTRGPRRCWVPWRRSRTSPQTRPTDPRSRAGCRTPTARGCTRCCCTGTRWGCRSEGSTSFHRCRPRSHCHRRTRRWWRCTTCYCTGTRWENRLGNKNKQVSWEVSNPALTTGPALAHYSRLRAKAQRHYQGCPTPKHFSQWQRASEATASSAPQDASSRDHGSPGEGGAAGLWQLRGQRSPGTEEQPGESRGQSRVSPSWEQQHGMGMGRLQGEAGAVLAAPGLHLAPRWHYQLPDFRKHRFRFQDFTVCLVLDILSGMCRVNI